jgi:hypothetical protein
VFVGGIFSSVGGTTAFNVARRNGESWASLTTPGEDGFGVEGPVAALAWNGTAWENIGAALEEGAFSPQIRALSSAGGYLVAVGQFPILGGAALFDGAKWAVLTDMNFMGSAALRALRRALRWRRLQPRGR